MCWVAKHDALRAGFDESPDLDVIGSVAAPASGTFSFEDTNTPSFPSRFYRLSVP